VFCTNEAIRTLNTRFFKKDNETDVIAFSYEEEDEKDNIAGEVYVSVDQAKIQCFLYGATVGQELARLVVHGALHLCGYSDSDDAERSIMRGKEDTYIAMTGMGI